MVLVSPAPTSLRLNGRIDVVSWFVFGCSRWRNSLNHGETPAHLSKMILVFLLVCEVGDLLGVDAVTACDDGGQAEEE